MAPKSNSPRADPGGDPSGELVRGRELAQSDLTSSQSTGPWSGQAATRPVQAGRRILDKNPVIYFKTSLDGRADLVSDPCRGQGGGL